MSDHDDEVRRLRRTIKSAMRQVADVGAAYKTASKKQRRKLEPMMHDAKRRISQAIKDLVGLVGEEDARRVVHLAKMDAFADLAQEQAGVRGRGTLAA